MKILKIENREFVWTIAKYWKQMRKHLKKNCEKNKFYKLVFF